MSTIVGVTPLSALAFAAGVAAQVFSFRHGEWDRMLPKAITLTFTTNLAVAAYICYGHSGGKTSLLSALGETWKLTFMAIAGTLTSMAIYRGFFHRLGSFPGPFLARFSNFYVTSLSVRKFHLFEEVQKLHKKHGDFVRLGPSELSINNPAAVEAIHSAKTKCTKGPWYSGSHPQKSLQQARAKLEHSKRRKVWDRGFSSKALRDYEPRVTTHTIQLMKQIEQRHEEPINVTQWFNFYSFDVMSDLAFGKSFDMLQEGVVHYFMTALHGFMEMIGIFSHVVWLLPVFRSIPILNAEDQKFWKFVVGETEKRRQNPPDRPDIMSWILEDYDTKKKPTSQEQLDLYGDSQLIIVAGSDTTAATLTCLFYEIAQRPEVEKAIQKEVDELFDTADVVIDSTTLSKLKYLDACISETLRLHPPVPSGVQRVTPASGIEVDGTYIPGNTIVQVPIHSMHRDERNFTRADEFLPERWTTKPELIKNPQCYLPFVTGPYGCVGKALALMEVRQVGAQIVRKYNIKFAPGQTTEEFEKSVHDCFTIALGPLYLKFDKREGIKETVDML